MKKSIFFIVIICAFLFPIISFAGNLKGPLVPCGREGQDACTLCDIFVMLQTIIDFITLGIFIFAPIFIAAGGIMILISADTPDRLNLGKSMIKNAIIGLVIALLAWTAINMIFNKMVSTDKDKFPAPWNKIECKGGGVGGGGDEQQEGEYCVCKTPVYNLNPDEFPEASIMFYNVKVKPTPFENKEACAKECVSANANSYCLSSLRPAEAKLYCASKSYLQNTKACSVHEVTTLCTIGGKCYNSEKECLDDALNTFKSKCYIDGRMKCKCFTGSARDTCGKSSTQYSLWRNKELPSGGSTTTLFDCESSESSPCRLNCQYVQCAETPSNVCNKLNPPLNQKAACSWDSYWTCQQGVSSQWNDACTELRSLINCMKTKSLPSGAREISSISDNSPETSGSLPGCFKAWTSQCSGSTDSCTGTCCGHRQCSLHYGGKARSDFGPSSCGEGSVDCRKCSWAVDFANESYLSQIKTAAEDCAEDLGLGEIYINKEENHIHVGLNGKAKASRCYKANE